MHEFEIDVRDKETGVVERKVFREVQPKARAPRDKDFHRMRPGALHKLINSELSGADFKVLLALCYECVWTNRVDVHKAQIADVAHISPKAVYNSLTKLHLLRFVHFPNGTTRGACMIDPEICWRGYTEALGAAVSEYARLWREYDARLEARTSDTTCGAPQSKHVKTTGAL